MVLAVGHLRLREQKTVDEIHQSLSEQVRKHKGIVLSIDGIQPDTGNETMYLMRDV
jgi:hypothetical protein